MFDPLWAKFKLNSYIIHASNIHSRVLSNIDTVLRSWQSTIVPLAQFYTSVVESFTVRYLTLTIISSTVKLYHFWAVKNCRYFGKGSIFVKLRKRKSNDLTKLSFTVYLQVFETMGGAQRLQESAKRAFPRWLGYRVSVRFLHGVFSSCQSHTDFWPPAHLPNRNHHHCIV